MRPSIPRFILLTLLLVSPGVNAATFLVPTDRELIRTADTIVIGEVVTMHPTLDDKGEIVTKVIIDVSRVLKGDPTIERVELTELGGVLGNRARGVSGAPEYEPGMRVLVFIDESGKPHVRTHQMMMGRFRFIPHGDGGELLVRGSEGEPLTGYASDGSVHRERPRRAVAFIDYVDQIARGVNVLPNYFADVPSWPEDPLPRPFVPQIGSTEPPSRSAGTMTGSDLTSSSDLTITTMSHYPPSAYSMSGPARWSIFDTGGSVTFRTNGSQPGFDGVGAAQRGTAAWTNEPNSNVRYGVSGTTTGGFTRDGVNSIIFNSPSSVTSGALALGQWYASGTHTYKGETFYTIIEGDVIFGQNLNLSQKVFDEIMTHELGHTLSFRHSNEGTPSSSAAVMNSIVSGNYGATLAPWDVEAVTHMYGSGTTSNPDLGRTTVTFTDDPLVAGVTIIKAIHIIELRQAVNEIRANAGLSAYAFRDPTLTGVVVKAVHITELRTALDQARAALGLSTGGWTDPTITPGVTIIKAVHIQEIRNRMK